MTTTTETHDHPPCCDCHGAGCHDCLGTGHPHAAGPRRVWFVLEVPDDDAIHMDLDSAAAWMDRQAAPHTPAGHRLTDFTYRELPRIAGRSWLSRWEIGAMPVPLDLPLTWEGDQA